MMRTTLSFTTQGRFSRFEARRLRGFSSCQKHPPWCLDPELLQLQRWAEDRVGEFNEHEPSHFLN